MARTCPNPSCPSYQITGTSAEYADHQVECALCQSMLIVETGDLVSRQRMVGARPRERILSSAVALALFLIVIVPSGMARVGVRFGEFPHAARALISSRCDKVDFGPMQMQRCATPHPTCRAINDIGVAAFELLRKFEDYVNHRKCENGIAPS